MLSSDPLITSMRPRLLKNSKVFSKESLEMLITESFANSDKSEVEEFNEESDEGFSEDVSEEEFL